MAIYAQDLYGRSYYGVDVVVTFSVGNATAIQTGYGEITLHWTTPKNTQSWSDLRVVRNTSGYPAFETDGDIIVDFTSADSQNTFTDSGLTGGRFYYYAWFIASAFPAYSSSTTYQLGDTVSYNGSNWICLLNNTQNIAPVSGSANWQATNATSLWNRAGQAASLAVADYGYTSLLYNLLPTPYSSSQQEISAPQATPNSQLQRYLSVLAWGLDTARTELGEQARLNRAETMPLSRMEHLAFELGIPAEASITPRLRRRRVVNGAALAKRKGTLESIAEAIYGATGYGATITASPNRMLDADQAEFHWPRYSAWDPSSTYVPGSIVSFQGYLYSAASNTVLVEAELCTITLSGTPSSIIQGNLPSATYSNNQQVLFQSNAVGQSATLTFSVPSTGNYDLSIGMTSSYDYGIVTFAVDGTTVTSSTAPFTWPPTSQNLAFDGYAASPTPATSVYLGNVSLASGSHTIKVTVAGKDPQSGTASYSHNGGFQMGVDYLTYTPSGSVSGTGTSPSGTTANNAFWTLYSGTGGRSHALDNPLTGGISTWEMISFTAGATPSPSYLSVYSGYQSIDGVGDQTSNVGIMNNGTGSTATLAVHSIPRAQLTPWNATNTYPRGTYVSYNGVNYLAILPNQGDIPNADITHWQPETISTTGPDRYLVSSYGLPLAHTTVWDAGTQYTAGSIVQYLGQKYIAAAANQGSAPTGRPTDTTTWAWLGSAQDTYTASAWTVLFTSTTSATRSLYIEFYDATGNLITTINPTPNTFADLLVGFSRYSTNLTTDPGASSALNGLTWTSSSSTDIPVASSGMAYWATRNDPNGRQMVTNYGQSNVNVGLTFMTGPPTNVEHGLALRWSDSNNFWSASRTRLVKKVAGALTTVASWSSLPDGSRIYVSLSGSIITVYQYQGPGLAPIQLATVTDSFNSTAAQFGIFERVYS